MARAVGGWCWGGRGKGRRWQFKKTCLATVPFFIHGQN